MSEYTGSEHRYLVDVILHVDAVNEEEAVTQAHNVLYKTGFAPDGSGDVTVGEGVSWVNVLDAEHQSEACDHIDHLLDHMSETHAHRREGLETVSPTEVKALHSIEHKLITASHSNEGIHEVIPEHRVDDFSRVVHVPAPHDWRNNPDYDEATDSIKR